MTSLDKLLIPHKGEEYCKRHRWIPFLTVSRYVTGVSYIREGEVGHVHCGSWQPCTQLDETWVEVMYTWQEWKEWIRGSWIMEGTKHYPAVEPVREFASPFSARGIE